MTKRKLPYDGNTEENRIALKDKLFELITMIPHNKRLLVNAEIPLIDKAKALNEDIKALDNFPEDKKQAFQNHNSELSSFMDLLHEKLNEIFEIADSAATLINTIAPDDEEAEIAVKELGAAAAQNE